MEKNIHDFERLLCLLCGMVGSGKTTLQCNLGKVLSPSVFAHDKDFYDPFARKIFELGGQASYDRTSRFFYESGIRDLEVDISEASALFGMNFAKYTLLSAPYNSEIRAIFGNQRSERFFKLRNEVRKRGGALVLVFIDITEQVAKEHLITRGKNDPEKAALTRHAYKDLDAFVSSGSQNLRAPEGMTEFPDIDFFFRFNACKPQESFEELKAFLGCDKPDAYDPEIAVKYGFGKKKESLSVL